MVSVFHKKKTRIQSGNAKIQDVLGHAAETNPNFQLANKPSPISDGPLEKLSGVGNFRAAGIFFRYQIPCLNFF